MPFADTAIARYLCKKIDEKRGVKTQREIAAEIGYDKPNLISMFKRGETKVPLEKIPALAKALGADPGHLFRLALAQYWPGAEAVIERIFGCIATRNEERILLRKWRAATDGLDPPPNPDFEAAVDKCSGAQSKCGERAIKDDFGRRLAETEGTLWRTLFETERTLCETDARS
jgi:transcriptional regulator with XRE-family HTH domain